MTNGDKVRNMTNEELADFLYNGCDVINYPFCAIPGFSCRECYLSWLKEEYHEEVKE